jgi:hypothetical protein
MILLESGQKSFVSETVGGVYQINVLKSVLRDLGSGFSIYENAVKAAGDSTAAAQVRIDQLNTTISSQLTRTLNNLTQTSATVGTTVLGPTIRGGAGAFDRILKSANSTLSENGEGFGANILPDKLAKGFAIVFQGIAKGLGNVLSGPGVQFAVFGLIKLFQRLQSFVIDSVKDLTNVNEKAKEREAIETAVLAYLNQEKTVIKDLLAGHQSINSVHDSLLDKLKKESFFLEKMSIYAPAIADALQASGVRVSPNPTSKKKSASGFIPNLVNIAKEEMMGAHSGGYAGGQIVSTSVSDGGISKPVIANGAETKSVVKVGSKTYEWINPPENSRAGMSHAMRSKMLTGVNPYDLQQHNLAASGLTPEYLPKDFQIPITARNISESTEIKLLRNLLKTKYNLPLAGENLSNANETLNALKTQYKGDKLKARDRFLNPFKIPSYTKGYMMAFGHVPNLAPTVQSDALINVAKQRLNGVNIGDGDLFEQVYQAKARPSIYNLSESKKVILGILRSTKFGNRYSDKMTGKISDEGNRIAQSVADLFGKSEKLGNKTVSGDIPNEVIQNMLNLRGPEFAALVAFGDFTNKTQAGAGQLTGETEIGGTKFKVPFKYSGLINPKGAYESFKKEYISATQGLKRGVFDAGSPVKSLTNEGQVFGNIFDSTIKSVAEDLGVKTGEGNENLDILGYDPKLVEKFSPIKPFAGADVKTSLGPETSKQMAAKIARALALKRGAGDAEIPPFQNIKRFTGTNAGFLDYDYFNGGRNEFDALVYGAMSTGKPVKVNIGPAGAGKTTDALRNGRSSYPFSR